ncbi:MAG: glycosyltransferase family 4 protein [Planctomycetaceae bacterium]
MKILLLNDAATPGGGAEVMTIALRDELRTRGHDARIFASSAQYGEQASAADYSCFGTTSGLRTANRVFNVSAYWKLRSVLSAFRPDVVHVRMFFTQLSPSILPLLRRFPSIYHACWYESICPTGLKLLPDGAVCQDAAGMACCRNGCISRKALLPLTLQQHLWQRWRNVFDVIVANSNALGRTLEENGIDHVEVVWNGVPVVAERLPLVSPPTAAYAGRLSWEKGVDVLLQSFPEVVAQIPDAQLLIAGDGPQRGELDRLVEHLGLGDHVQFLGHRRRDELQHQLEGAWVHVVPSRLDEPFGVAAAEAMMRGTAVVATFAGGLSELVEDDRTGVFVPRGDIGALSTAIVRLLNDRILAEQLGSAGRRRAMTHFSMTTYADKLTALYESLSQPSSSTAGLVT